MNLFLTISKMNEAINLMNQAVLAEDINTKETLQSLVEAITKEVEYDLRNNNL